MSDDKKLPKINLSPKEISDLLKDFPHKDFPPTKKNSHPSYLCNICQDTKKVLVCGGPQQDCPSCGPRY